MLRPDLESAFKQLAKQDAAKQRRKETEEREARLRAQKEQDRKVRLAPKHERCSEKFITKGEPDGVPFGPGSAYVHPLCGHAVVWSGGDWPADLKVPIVKRYGVPGVCPGRR